MNGPHLTKRRGMTIFKYTQVRKYTHIPPDFLLQMKTWFIQQKFKIKKNHRGHGHLSGRRDGIHINFVPKFLITVKEFKDHAEVTFSYAARIRKIGIATALLTEGLSLIIGAVTLSAHIAAARGFVDTVTDTMDSISGAPFEVNWVEAEEAPGARSTTTTTTTQVHRAPEPVIPVRPPSPVVMRAITPPAPVPNLMDVPVVEKPVVVEQAQPQIIVVPQSTIVIQAPPMGYPYGMQGYMGMPFPALQSASDMSAFNPSQSALPQIAYQPSNSVSIGEATMPAMFERPSMLTSTRYPMPYQQMAPMASAAPSNPPLLEIEYPMQSSMPMMTPSSFSLTEPMFPKKESMPVNRPLSYGSARA